jgi:hypothetical protein
MVAYLFDGHRRITVKSIRHGVLRGDCFRHDIRFEALFHDRLIEVLVLISVVNQLWLRVLRLRQHRGLDRRRVGDERAAVSVARGDE